MAKLNFNPECENVGGKWHYISETQLLTLVITGGDPFWIKSVARFPLTSVCLGLRVWSCREVVVNDFTQGNANGVMDLRDMAVCCQSWTDSFLLLAFSSIPFSFDCGNMLICLFLLWWISMWIYSYWDRAKKIRSGKAEKFWFCSYRNLNHCPCYSSEGLE